MKRKKSYTPRPSQRGELYSCNAFLDTQCSSSLTALQYHLAGLSFACCSGMTSLRDLSVLTARKLKKMRFFSGQCSRVLGMHASSHHHLCASGQCSRVLGMHASSHHHLCASGQCSSVLGMHASSHHHLCASGQCSRVLGHVFVSGDKVIRNTCIMAYDAAHNCA